jgi:L-lactate dehydrogenase complex protein LldG
MNARDAIIGRIRANRGGKAGDPASIAAAAKALLSKPESGRPRIDAGEPGAIFAAHLVSPKVGASIDEIAGLEDVPQAVRRYLDAQGLDAGIAVQPDPALLRLDWTSFDLLPRIEADAIVGVGKALWGIAETGTLVFHSGPASPTLFSFLPLHHLVVIERTRILSYLEDYALLVQDGAPPRNVNFITGASGTTDIEGTLVKGAHGPRFLHVIIVGPGSDRSNDGKRNDRTD